MSPARPAARLTLAAALLLGAGPASGVVPSTATVLKRVGQKREALALATLEARGALWATGEAARALSAATGASVTSGEVTAEVLFSMKAPGRCRVELPAPAPGAADRPFAAVHRARSSGKGLERVAELWALLRATCSMVALRPGGTDAGKAYAEELARIGVPLDGATLGKVGQRVSWVVGGPAGERRPQAWFDLQQVQPARLVTSSQGRLWDVRFLEWGVAPGGDLFPRVVEVHDGGGAVLRFTVSQVASNPRVADALFP